MNNKIAICVLSAVFACGCVSSRGTNGVAGVRGLILKNSGYKVLCDYGNDDCAIILLRGGGVRCYVVIAFKYDRSVGVGGEIPVSFSDLSDRAVIINRDAAMKYQAVHLYHFEWDGASAATLQVSFVGLTGDSVGYDIVLTSERDGSTIARVVPRSQNIAGQP